MCQKFSNTMVKLIKARSGLLWARTNEEARAEAHILAVAQAIKHFKKIYVWKSTTGLVDKDDKTGDNAQDELATLCKNPAYGPLNDQPDGILEFLSKFKGDEDDAEVLKNSPVLVIMEDLSDQIGPNSPNRAQAMRLLKDLNKLNQNSRLNRWAQIVVIDKNPAPDMFIEVELDLPSRREIEATVRGTINMRPEAERTRLTAELESEGALDEVLDSLVGLENKQVEQAVAVSLAEAKAVRPELLMRSKRALLRSDALEWVEPGISGLDDIGGLEPLKEYFKISRVSFLLAQRETDVPRPRGLLIAGVPGTGKSLGAKALAAAWKLPLVRLNIGALFGKFQGDSESNWRRAKKVVEALAPCVLWIDEIEKGVQGFGGGGADTDGGTTARIGSDFLTWLNETDKPIYIVATANDPMKVPAEFFRAGRFDACFFVDVPNVQDRTSVLEVVAKKWRSMSNDGKYVSELGLDYDCIARELKDYTGAELEQAIMDGIKLAVYHDKPLTTDDVVDAGKKIVPVVRSWAGKDGQPGTLERAREWGKQQRQANNPEDESPKAAAVGVGEVGRQILD